MRVPASLKAFGSLVPALRPEWPGMVRSYVIGTISAMSLVALTVLSAWAVGHAVVDRVLPGPVLWLGLGGLVLARTVLTWREMDVSHALAYRVLARLRMALFDAYARSVPGKKREHSGRVASVAMDDIEKLEFFYAHTIAQVATSITVFLASAITALAILPPAGGVVVLGGAVIATSAFYWAHTARRLGAAEQHERTEMSAGIVDALGGAARGPRLQPDLSSRPRHPRSDSARHDHRPPPGDARPAGDLCARADRHGRGHRRHRHQRDLRRSPRRQRWRSDVGGGPPGPDRAVDRGCLGRD